MLIRQRDGSTRDGLRGQAIIEYLLVVGALITALVMLRGTISAQATRMWNAALQRLP